MANWWRKPFDADIKAVKPGRVIIDKDKCKGCSYCTEFCPRDALVMSQEINAKGYTLAVVSDEKKCLACGLCEVICPEFAIKVEGKITAIKE
ncbi:MAG TPA: ferredoxin family protein [Dehalococcoidales bacterium]|jgi:2-oxoglutarate ferredoxin oxidoreductase subunit delta